MGFYGDTEVPVAIRLRRPLAGEVEAVEAVVDPLVVRLSGGTGRLSPEVAVTLRQELLALDYDGIIVREAEGPGVDYVIALLGDTVKVIVA